MCSVLQQLIAKRIVCFARQPSQLRFGIHAGAMPERQQGLHWLLHVEPGTEGTVAECLASIGKQATWWQSGHQFHFVWAKLCGRTNVYNQLKTLFKDQPFTWTVTADAMSEAPAADVGAPAAAAAGARDTVCKARLRKRRQGLTSAPADEEAAATAQPSRFRRKHRKAERKGQKGEASRCEMRVGHSKASNNSSRFRHHDCIDHRVCVLFEFLRVCRHAFPFSSQSSSTCCTGQRPEGTQAPPTPEPGPNRGAGSHGPASSPETKGPKGRGDGQPQRGSMVVQQTVAVTVFMSDGFVLEA